MPDLTLLSVSGPVATLSLNRPDARNALSIELLDALLSHVAELERLGSNEPRPEASGPGAHAPTILVLKGAGKAFCAGMDLRAVLDNDALARRLLLALADFTLRLRALPMVTIASVNGAAIGGGCGLACVCDFAVTHADSKMGFPEVDLGVCPAVVAPWLVRRIGPGAARRVLLTGGLMSGQEAARIGMVSQAVPSLADLDGAVDALARRLSEGGPNALLATKSLLNQLDGSLDADLVRRGAELSADVLATPDAQSRLRAKLTK